MARKGPTDRNEGKENRTNTVNDTSLRLTRGQGGRGAGTRAQLRRVGRRIWDDARKEEFLAVLAATCNVEEACRAVSMSNQGAYNLRLRDPAFAAAWKRAVEQGYSELEMLLLRQSLHGSTTTETVEDGEGQCKQVKTVHSYPHTIALRLFQAHQSTAEAVRAEQDASPDSDQIRAEIQVRIAAMRVRSGGAKAGREGEES